jgi:SAM-dependent methyltransferase
MNSKIFEVDMVESPNTEINIEEIMRKIKEEVERRKKLSQEQTYQQGEESVSKSSTIEDNPSKKSFDHLLWKYGRRYKKIIKKIPVLEYIAKKQHLRLAHQFGHPHPVTHESLPGHLDINVLPYYINYHGFLIQVKEREGLKGRIKSFLFKFIRFFAWWQEQINRALYQELMTQKAKMDERDRWVQELLHQQMNSLKEDLSRRDKIVEGLDNRVALLSQAKDELSRELAERDRFLEELGNRLNLFGQAKDELSRELSDQKIKIDETGKWMESFFNRQMEGIKGELAERDKVIESLNDRLVQFDRVKEDLNQGLTIQKEKLDGMEKHTQNLLSQGMDNLKSEFIEAYKNLNDAMESVKKELSGLLEVKSAISHITEEMRDHKFNILDQQRRFTLLLEEAKKRLPKPIGPKQIKTILKEEDHLLDAMYVAFEDRFRGTREEIKERLKVYLPHVQQANIGKPSSPILDLGCGRGEWLELLRENGHIARGVDLNRVMVGQCQEIGLDVTESDMIEYLRNQRPNSFGALTGFHILEHLSLNAIISLLDEALRVLKSGGIVIFETPNPENLIVAACNFYFDPTHKHPLPPRLLNFLIESRGFEKAEITRLHPYAFFREEQKTSAAVEALISLFNMEQDYSVIAYKG